MRNQGLSASTWIKLVLAALMVLCLFPMPYGFYNLVRFLSMIGFAILAGRAYLNGSLTLSVIYGSLMLLFQPFIKFVLGRDIWIVVDVAVALFLIFTIVKNRKIGAHKQK